MQLKMQICSTRLSFLMQLLQTIFPSIAFCLRRAFLSCYCVILVKLKVYAMMSESKLKDLALRGRNWTVCARVSRMWDYRGGTDDGDILHVDLVLVDSEGSAMYAEIGADDVEDKKPLLTEGKAYIFQRFMVANAKSTFRPVESKYMIKITCHTLIKEVENPLPPIPLHVYKLTKFADLPDFIGENKRFLDVLGLITEVSELEVVNFVSPRPATVRRAITLRDASNYQMKVLLWGQRAREFEIDDLYALGQEEPVAILFVGTLMKCYSREDCLSGNAACRWYINPDIPETNHLLESLHGGFDPIQRVVVEGHARAQQVPVVQPQPITIDKIPTSPYDFPSEGFLCTVTISRVNEEQSWWFPSCNRCGKTSYPDGSGYKCLDCGCLTIKYKFKICLFGVDGTGEAEFVFFGDMGRRLIGKQVQPLLRSVRRADDIPSEIAAIVSQKYCFTINVTSRSFTRSQQSYQVIAINRSYGRQSIIPPVPRIPRLEQVDNRNKSSAAAAAAEEHHQTTAENTSIAVISSPDHHDEILTPTQDGTSTPPLNLAAESPLLKHSTADSLGDDHTDKSVRKRLFSPADSVDLDTKDSPKSAIPDMAPAAADKTLTDRAKLEPSGSQDIPLKKICPGQERKENLGI